MEKMRLSGGKLIGNAPPASQISRGETCRTTENAPAIKTIGARLPQIEGNFADSVTELLPIMVAEGTKNRRSFI